MSNSPEEMLQSILNDPEAINKISSLFGSLGGGEEKKQNAEERKEGGVGLPFGLDNPETLMKISSMYSKISNEDDPRVNLLLALKPYMNDKRRDKTEHAIKLLKMSKMSSLFGELNIL